MPNKVKRLVALYDVHFPYTVPEFYNVARPKTPTPVLNFIKDFDPTHILWGGDQLDLDCITYHNRGKPKLTEGKRLSTDFDGFNKLLDRVDKIAPDAESTMLTGNHELWLQMLIEENPQAFEGLIELEKNLNLKARGIKLIKHRGVAKYGKLNAMHGDYKNGYTATYHAKAIADLFNRNLIYGHFHTEQSYVKTSPVDSHSIKTQGVGTLAGLNPLWMRNAPNAWLNSFYVAYLQPDGNYSGYVIQIINGRFIFDGQVYQSGKRLH